MQKNNINSALKHLSKHDKVLSRIIKKNAFCNLQPHNKYFNSLLRDIVGQQLSLASAAAINKRFMNHFKHKPKPEDIISTDEITLRSFGLSNAKVKYVKDLSQKIISEEISLKGLKHKTDEEIIAELTKVKGIGIWTVQMFLIFTLGRPDVLPVTDLGIRKSIMLNYGLKKMPDEKKVAEISQKFNWSPYNSIASWYLWEALDTNFESFLK